MDKWWIGDGNHSICHIYKTTIIIWQLGFKVSNHDWAGIFEVIDLKMEK